MDARTLMLFKDVSRAERAGFTLLLSSPLLRSHAHRTSFVIFWRSTATLTTVSCIAEALPFSTNKAIQIYLLSALIYSIDRHRAERLEPRQGLTTIRGSFFRLIYILFFFVDYFLSYLPSSRNPQLRAFHGNSISVLRVSIWRRHQSRRTG